MQQVTNPEIEVANPDEPLSDAAITVLAEILLAATDEAGAAAPAADKDVK